MNETLVAEQSDDIAGSLLPETAFPHPAGRFFGRYAGPMSRTQRVVLLLLAAAVVLVAVLLIRR